MRWTWTRRVRGIAVLLLLGLSACGPPPLRTLEGEAQGTSWHLRWWARKPTDGVAIEVAVRAELERIDRLMSNYRADSTIERFNAARDTEPHAVGAEIVELVARAGKVGAASGGCYDLTSKPLFDLWGFRGDLFTPPDTDNLQAARAHVGIDRIAIVDAAHLGKRDPESTVDLASIAQGYSVGRLAALLEAAGVRDYLVEIGGELQARGTRPDGERWRVALERPLPGARQLEKVLLVGGEPALAVMTSGTYQHYFDAAGQRYSHILDARNGAPVRHATVAVTVVGEDPSMADAWSTALLCLGRVDGLALAEREHLRALFVEQIDAKLVESSTRRWQAEVEVARDFSR